MARLSDAAAGNAPSKSALAFDPASCMQRAITPSVAQHLEQKASPLDACMELPLKMSPMGLLLHAPSQRLAWRLSRDSRPAHGLQAALSCCLRVDVCGGRVLFASCVCSPRVPGAIGLCSGGRRVWRCGGGRAAKRDPYAAAHRQHDQEPHAPREWVARPPGPLPLTASTQPAHSQRLSQPWYHRIQTWLMSLRLIGCVESGTHPPTHPPTHRHGTCLPALTGPHARTWTDARRCAMAPPRC